MSRSISSGAAAKERLNLKSQRQKRGKLLSQRGASDSQRDVEINTFNETTNLRWRYAVHRYSALDKSCETQSKFRTNCREISISTLTFYGWSFRPNRRADRELNVVKRARFNETIETYKTNGVPEPNLSVAPHTVKELPALPVSERQQDNMLLHQQIQDNMLEEEVSFGQRAQQQQQDQQQLQLRQHNIPHNPIYPKQVMSPNRPNVEAPNQGGPPGPEALYQQNNLLQQIVHLEWNQGLREIVHDNNSSIEQIVAEVRRINHAMGKITGGLNNAFGQVRTDADNQRQGMASSMNSWSMFIESWEY